MAAVAVVVVILVVVAIVAAEVVASFCFVLRVPPVLFVATCLGLVLQ